MTDDKALQLPIQQTLEVLLAEMTKALQRLDQRIEALEQRVRELEAQPRHEQHFHWPANPPVIGPGPYPQEIVCGGAGQH